MSEEKLKDGISHMQSQKHLEAFAKEAYVDDDKIALPKPSYNAIDGLEKPLTDHFYKPFGYDKSVFILANGRQPAPELEPEKVEAHEEYNRLKNSLGHYLLTAGHDDEGNAQCLLRMFSGQFLYCSAYGWMTFNGKYWRSETAESELDRAIVKTLKARLIEIVKTGKPDMSISFAKPNAVRLNGCKYLFKSIVEVSVDSFDNSPDLLNCNNGVIDLRTGKLTPHDATQRFTYCIPINYNPDANFEPWVIWLREALGGSADVLNYVKMALGYSLTGRTSEECLFYLYGPTRAGKGTYTETIESMLGKPLAKGTEFSTFAVKRDPDANNFDLAGLKPTRFVSAGESDTRTYLSARRIKSLTGGDTVRCCFKFKDHFEYKPQYKIWLASNHLKANPTDDALWTRLKVIVFPKSYAGREDKKLKQRMLSTDNLEGVLLWAVQGAIDWYASDNGLEQPPSVVEDTEKRRKENDTILQFLEDCTDDSDNLSFLPASVLAEVYLSWCELNGHEPEPRELSRRLKDHSARSYLTSEELKDSGYDRIIKLKDDEKRKQFRGYPGLSISSEVLKEYL